MVDYTRLLLQKRSFEEMHTNARDVQFYVKVLTKEEQEDVRLCMLVDNRERNSVSTPQIIRMAEQIERNLLLKGFRHIDIMCFIFTADTVDIQALSQSDLSYWIVDTKKRRLMIYDDQPDDYEAMKGLIEYELECGQHQKIRRKVERMHISYATWGLILANILVYVVISLFGDPYNVDYMLQVGANTWKNVFVDHEYYRLITSVFLHFGFEHLLSNMFMLGLLGLQIENVLGTFKFLVIYIVSGIGAGAFSLFYYAYKMQDQVVSAGASGAIFGIMGALAATVIKDRNKFGAGVGFKILIVLVLVVFNDLNNPTIDYMAHFGGLIIGFLLTFITYKEDSRYAGYKKG